MGRRVEGGTSAEQVRILLVVETNFMFSAIVEEKRDSVHLLGMARRKEFTLAIPKVALAEAENTIRQRLHRWRVQVQEMRASLNPVRNVSWARRATQTIWRNLAALESKIGRQHGRVSHAIQNVARFCLVIPHTPETHTRGHLRHLAGRPPFKETDCELFEAILQFLSEHAAEYTHIIFLNLDREDFDHPEIREELSPFNVELYFAPGEVIGRIRQIMGLV